MTLAEILATNGITTALIVDDVCDAVPTADDIGTGNDAWPIFNDDLDASQRATIEAAHPAAAQLDFDQLIADNTYVAAIWALRAELGAVAAPLFEQYLADQAADQRFVDLAVNKLTALGVACQTSGRDFADAAQSVDLIVIDLFFNKAQNGDALDESKERLRKVIDSRRRSPPLVILMSRSPRLEDKRDEFRDEVGLLDSGFRIIRKAQLETSDKFERQLERLANNAKDSRQLAHFFGALEEGMEAATRRTLNLFRNLRLSDIGQIQRLLLNAEGEPTGSYLVDVFDRVLQHEVERESGIIDAAISLNSFSAASHPSPYVAGSPDLQELVERLLTQNGERLRLPGSIDAQVTFGDILTVTPTTDLTRLRTTTAVDVDENTAMLVLTPVCDLQREGAPRILLLIGRLRSIDRNSWQYGGDARTAAIRIGRDLRWIKWNLKHIDTVSRDHLDEAFGNKDLIVAARLREAHALELQQRLLSGLGRVGLVAAMPATFSVDVEVYYPGTDKIPARLNVPALNDGAVCFVGRTAEGGPALRLVMTDLSCDGVIEALAALEPEQVAAEAHPVLAHVKASADVRQLLENGLDLKGAKPDRWFHIPSPTANNALPKMGLLAWNFDFPTTPLPNSDLRKAGIIIVVKDKARPDGFGLEDALRSGLVSVAADGADDQPLTADDLPPN